MEVYQQCWIEAGLVGGQMFCQFKSARIGAHKTGALHQENSSPKHKEAQDWLLEDGLMFFLK